jgi:hypothetical protein
LHNFWLGSRLRGNDNPGIIALEKRSLLQVCLIVAGALLKRDGSVGEKIADEIRSCRSV